MEHSQHERVVVLDFGGQYAQLIARRVRDLGVYCEIKNYKTDPEALRDCKGIIFTGGPNSVYAEGAPLCSKAVFGLGVPVLGICYGAQAMAHLRELGTVVYLKLGYRALAKRLGSLKRRGVVLRPGQTLRMLYEERVPLYEQYAHLTIDCSGQDVEHTLDRVMRALEKRGQG